MMRKINKNIIGSVRSLFLSVLVLAVCISLLGCGEPQGSCAEALDDLLSDTPLPAGERYAFGADEGENGYLSPETARALYGEDSEGTLALCADFAIFISSRPNPFEAAVFRCYSATDTDVVAEMLLQRIADVQISLRDTSIAGAYDTAYVEVRGREVIMRGGVQNISK